MKLNLLLAVLVALALVAVATVTVGAVIATQAVIYRGEAAESAADPCAAEPIGPNQAQPVVENMNPNLANGIDRCKQDLNLRAPSRVEYAYVILHRRLLETHAGGCGGLPTPQMAGWKRNITLATV